MFEDISDPVLGKLVGHLDAENWSGRVELRPGESADLLISYGGGEDVDLSVEELLEFARVQLTRVRAGIDRCRKRAARDIRKGHPQRNRPGVVGLSEAELAAGLKVAALQVGGSYDTTLLLMHPKLRGEIVVTLTPSGSIEGVEF